jgi:hypothetical protein
MTKLDLDDNLDLDVATPPEVAVILRKAAERFASDAQDLNASWQSKRAGRVWNRLARELERTALRAEQILNQEGW